MLVPGLFVSWGGLDKLQRDTGSGALSGWWERAGEEEEQKG